MKLRRRYFVCEVADGCDTWLAGNKSGYKTDAEAFRAAARLARKTDKTYSVGLYELFNGERDCVEILGYEQPPNS